MNAADTLSALGSADACLGELALRLRRASDVREVLRRTDLFHRPAIEWYVDAELTDGEAVSWRLQASEAGSTWTITADVSRIRTEGGEVLAELAHVVVAEAGLREGLTKAANCLVTASDIR